MTNKEQFKLGKEAFKAEKYQEARRSLSRVTRDDEKLYAQAQLMLAETQLEQRNERGALKYLKQVPNIDDEAIQSKKNYLFMNVYYVMEDIHRTKQYLSKVTRINEADFMDAQLIAGEYFLMNLQNDRAKTAFEQITPQYPREYAMAQYMLGNLCVECNQYKEAKTHYARVVKEMNTASYYAAQLALGFMEWDMGNRDDAVKCFQELDFTEMTPSLKEKEAIVIQILGDMEIKNKKYEAGIEMLSTMTRRHGAEFYAGAQLSMSTAYFKLNQPDKAYACLQKIKRSDNKEMFAMACFEMAVHLTHNNRHEDAVRMWEKIKKTDSQELYEKAVENIRRVQLNVEVREIDKWSKKKMSETVEQIETMDDNGLYFTAQVAITEKKYHEATRLLKRLSKDDEKLYAKAQILLSKNSYECGDFVAEKSYLKNVKKDMDIHTYNQAQQSLASLAFKNGEKEKAREYVENIVYEVKSEWTENAKALQGALEIDSGNEEKGMEILSTVRREFSPIAYANAQFNLAMAYARAEKVDKALHCFKQIKRSDNKELFACATVQIGTYYLYTSQSRLAQKYLRSVRRSDSEDAYFDAQKHLKNLGRKNS